MEWTGQDSPLCLFVCTPLTGNLKYWKPDSVDISKFTGNYLLSNTIKEDLRGLKTLLPSMIKPKP